jgi:hypothetical protein
MQTVAGLVVAISASHGGDEPLDELVSRHNPEIGIIVVTAKNIAARFEAPVDPGQQLAPPAAGGN